MKKFRLCSEAAYPLAICMMAFSVAMVSCTNFGMSMIVAPAYILSLKLGVITFGQAEYVVQGLLFVVMCLLLRKVKMRYFSSFLCGLAYGAVLDFWRNVIPHFNPAVVMPGALPFGLRIVYFALGTLLTAASVALFFRCYLYPQVYDFFVMAVCDRFQLNRKRFKIIYDFVFLAASVAMSLLLLGKLEGVGVGTIITTCVNGVLIDFFGKVLDRHVEIVPASKKMAERFSIS